MFAESSRVCVAGADGTPGRQIESGHCRERRWIRQFAPRLLQFERFAAPNVKTEPLCAFETYSGLDGAVPSDAVQHKST